MAIKGKEMCWSQGDTTPNVLHFFIFCSMFACMLCLCVWVYFTRVCPIAQAVLVTDLFYLCKEVLYFIE